MIQLAVTIVKEGGDYVGYLGELHSGNERAVRLGVAGTVADLKQRMVRALLLLGTEVTHLTKDNGDAVIEVQDD